MIGSFFDPIKRLAARAKRAAHTLDEKLRMPKVRAIRKEAEDHTTARTRKRNDRQEILQMLGLYGNAFSGLLAATLLGGSILSQIGDVPLQTLLILDTFNVSLIVAVIAGVILIIALTQLTSRLVRAAALRSTMFAPWLSWTLRLAFITLLLCIGAGGVMLYVRWLPASELESWNAAARYSRWLLSETLPVLGGLLAAAGWLVNIRHWATEEIETLDDEIAALRAITAEMDALLLPQNSGAMSANASPAAASPQTGATPSAPVIPFAPQPMERHDDAIQ